MSQGYREKCLSQKINTCYSCGSADDELVVHHVNGDEQDNRLDNLVPMCRSCHSRLHSAKNPTGTLGRLQEKLPESALSYTDTPSERCMGRNTTKRVALTPETKQLLDEQKPPGVTYDHYVRQLLGVE